MKELTWERFAWVVLAWLSLTAATWVYGEWQTWLHSKPAAVKYINLKGN
jgi:hypothetical protein